MVKQLTSSTASTTGRWLLAPSGRPGVDGDRSDTAGAALAPADALAPRRPDFALFSLDTLAIASCNWLARAENRARKRGEGAEVRLHGGEESVIPPRGRILPLQTNGLGAVTEETALRLARHFFTSPRQRRAALSSPRISACGQPRC
jgi:hypothetical protein